MRWSCKSIQILTKLAQFSEGWALSGSFMEVHDLQEAERKRTEAGTRLTSRKRAAETTSSILEVLQRELGSGEGSGRTAER